jgi:hypothetical protein
MGAPGDAAGEAKEAIRLRIVRRRDLATVGGDDALATASAPEQQTVSIADALTVSLLSAAAR